VALISINTRQLLQLHLLSGWPLRSRWLQKAKNDGETIK
jgi:hypothetical protein